MVVGSEFTRLSKMQHNILFFFACLNFELTSLKDIWAKVAEMHMKGVVFSKMFVLRSMGNELVPSPRLKQPFLQTWVNHVDQRFESTLNQR